MTQSTDKSHYTQKTPRDVSSHNSQLALVVAAERIAHPPEVAGAGERHGHEQRQQHQRPAEAEELARSSPPPPSQNINRLYIKT